MQHTELPAPEAAILTRLVGPDLLSLPPAACEAMLSLGFGSKDKHRMSELSATAQARRLTRRELAEVEAYSRIDSVLGILKSKARQALKHRRTANGKAKPH